MTTKTRPFKAARFAGIETYHISPTNRLGSRVKARWGVNDTTIKWDTALGVVENHERAAHAALAKSGRVLSPDERLVCASAPDASKAAYLWVVVESWADGAQ